MRESKIEKSVCEHARALGWWAIKIVPFNVRGFPDRMFLGHNARVIFIEFKAPNKKPTKLQWFHIGMLKNRGFETHIIDNVSEGKEVFNHE